MMSNSAYQKEVESDFSALFDNVQKLYKTFEDSSTSNIRQELLMKALTSINDYISLDQSMKTQETNMKCLEAIEFIFLSFEDNLLDAVPKSKWKLIIKYILIVKPELLTLFVSRLGRAFYQMDNNTKSELTYVTISYLNLLTERQMQRALAVIFRLFINPTNQNENGMFNKGYSDTTRQILRENVIKWQGMKSSM